ncbi:ATP-binding protein [Bradyrhizobium iriomotense]|uniref:ATP-binding protein n=1 Tax=Bradyrhizobium iriomotense TaxID=441950 RepID=UPI0024E0B9CC|nr:winged helix-turn-helix domain-containing protein [Bradyrhizobium iriomotense]
MLLRDGVVLPLGDRALDLLVYLAERPGEIVAKKELIDHVWPSVNVEEGSLRVHIAAIRKALGDGQFGDRYIANVQGRGYSFIGAINREAGAASTDDISHSRLPLRHARMIGRDAVVAEVKDGLREDRFVTLLGPGGIGKTTIAVDVGHAVAEEFDGEAFFVDLASLTDPQHVARTIGTSLGLGLGSSAPDQELVELVRSRRLLVILDNCEHVIDAVASIAEQLYQEAAQVHILATSREMLRVEGERCYHVPPFEVPPGDSGQTADAIRRFPAVQLFADRVMKDRGSALGDAEILLVVEMCRELDGVPLAIDLAARHAAGLGVKNTFARLASRAELMKLDHRTNVARHRTLKATLDWSADLLTEFESIVFRRIAPFVDYFTLEGARYVAGDSDWSEGQFFDAIAGLAGKSLIATRLVQGQPHYRLLNTTRAYALDRLEEHAEADAIFARHARYMTEQLESQSPSPPPQGTERAAVWSSQLSDIRAALEWSVGPRGDSEIARRLATASAAFDRAQGGPVSAVREHTEHARGRPQAGVKA